MKLVVGLGNPGREYTSTRHNIGFKIIDEYLGNVDWKEHKKYLYFVKDNNIFLKPLTYMNLSGEAVQDIVNFYKIDAKDILVIQDDLDMEFGKIKVKHHSTAGGHNGIKSIINCLGNNAFGRLKFGIGKSEVMPQDKYVLSKFSKEELEVIDKSLNKCFSIIDMFLNSSIEEVINNYNK